MSKKNKEAAVVTVSPEGEAVVTKVDKKAAKAAKKAAKAQKKADKKLKKATKEAKKTVKADKKSTKKSGKRGFGCPVRNLIVTALMSILLGAAFLVKPALVYTYCGYAIGGLVALVGLIYIIIYFCRKPVSGVYRSEFVIGLVAMLAGAYIALRGIISGSTNTTANLYATFVLIVHLIGIAIAADGILKLQYTLDILRMKYRKWWVALITSVLGIAVGIVTVMDITYKMGENFLGTNKGGMMLLGIAFCLNGVLDLIAMTVVAVRNHTAEKAALIAEAEAIVAAAAKEKDPDFFTAADTSADVINAPSSADISAEAATAEPVPAPVPMPEPQVELPPEPQIEHPAPAGTEPAPAPAPAAEPVPEPELPEPVLATPAEAE